MAEMTLEKVIALLEKEYKAALKEPYVRKPLAFALFRVWETVDDKEPGRKL